MRIKTIQTSNKNFILKYFRCRDGKRTETRIGMEGICITHSCIPPLWAIMCCMYTVYSGMQEWVTLWAIMCCMYTVYSGMQEWVIQIPSIPILVSVLFPSLHLIYFRIKFLLLVIISIKRLKKENHGVQGSFQKDNKEHWKMTYIYVYDH